jgi:FMN phosphatase YigB (HAD superfamily)
MRLTILLVSGGGFQGEGLTQVARLLGDVRVIIADSIEVNLGRIVADRYVVVPGLAERSLFASAIEKLARDEDVDLVFPCTDRELRVLASLKPRLADAGIRVAICPPPLIELLADKGATYAALLRDGIPSQQPQTPEPRSAFPLLGKPRNGWGGRGFETVHQWNDMVERGLAERMDDYCWVPWLETFEEFSADFAIGFSGDISKITLRRRLRTSSGFAVVSDSDDDEVVHGICAEVARWLRMRDGCGIFNMQVLRLPDETCFVSDINARHGTSSGHAAAAGNNLVGFMANSPSRSRFKRVRTVRTLELRSVPIPSPGCAPYRGVVFDLDDTLLDHKRWMMEKMLLAAAALSPDVAKSQVLEAAYAVIEEGQYESLIDRVVERLGLPLLRDRLLFSYRAALPELAPVFDDVRDTLLALRCAHIRIGLLTDNPPESQKLKLSRMPQITALVDATVFTRDVGEEKPSGAGFAHVADMLKLPPSALLMVGDNVARDAVGAISAGYAGCMLLHRPGGRFHVDEKLLASYLPQVASRTWVSPDLRTLTTACGISP